MAHSLLKSLAERRPIVGCWHAIVDPTVSEAIRTVDLDFVVFDQQHVAVTIESLQRGFIAFRPTTMAALVRMLRNDVADIGQVLDAGADGVIVPMVNTAAQARQAVAAARYRPDGLRSWGPRRAVLNYDSLDDYLEHANDSIVLAQIETAEAVENLDEILAVPGLTGIMVGPGDLAVSMGYLRDQDNPAVHKAIEYVLDRCLHHDVPFGLFTDSVAKSLDWIERGGLILNCHADVVFVETGMNQMADQFRQARSQRSPAHPSDATGS